MVTFLEHNHIALRHLFLKDYQGKQQDVIVYTRKELYDYLHYAHEQVYILQHQLNILSTFLIKIFGTVLGGITREFGFTN